MSSGIISKLFKKKSIRKSAEENISLSQARPKDFSNENLMNTLKIENIRLKSMKEKQDLTIASLSQKVEEMEQQIPEEEAKHLDELDEEIEKTKREIEEIRKEYREKTYLTTKNAVVIAQLEGEDFTELTKKRIERMKFSTNPQKMIEESRTKLKTKDAKLKNIKSELERQEEVENALIFIEKEHEKYKRQLKQIEERKNISKRLEEEEKNLQNQLEALQNTVEVNKKMLNVQKKYINEEKITAALRLFSNFTTSSGKLIEK